MLDTQATCVSVSKVNIAPVFNLFVWRKEKHDKIKKEKDTQDDGYLSSASDENIANNVALKKEEEPALESKKNEPDLDDEEETEEGSTGSEPWEGTLTTRSTSNRGSAPELLGFVVLVTLASGDRVPLLLLVSLTSDSRDSTSDSISESVIISSTDEVEKDEVVDQDETDLEIPVKRVVDVLELVLCSLSPSWLMSSSPSVSEYLSKEEESPNDRR